MCFQLPNRDAKKWVERWGPERWVFKYLESFTSRHPKILYFVSFLSFSWLATPWFGVGGLWPPNSFTNLGSIRGGSAFWDRTIFGQGEAKMTTIYLPKLS